MPADLGGTEHLSMGDRVHISLRESIVRRKFQPGHRINVDRVARELNVSAIPVREALRSLEVEGWVYFIPKRGAFVCKRSKEEAANLLETRLILEPQIARIASTRRTEADVNDLKNLVDDGYRAASSQSLSDFLEINTAFHEKLSRSTHNSVLVQLYSRILGYLELYYGAAVEQRMEQSAREHSSIYEAVRSRDSELAERLVEEHATATFNVSLSSLTNEIDN